MNTQEHAFFDLLIKIKEYGQIKSRDFVAYVIPFLKQLNEYRAQNKVAFLTSINKITIDKGFLYLDKEGEDFVLTSEEIFTKNINDSVLTVEENYVEYNDISSGTVKRTNLNIVEDAHAKIDRPVYFLNYYPWDYHQGVYDPLTDIFVAGQLLASLAFGLDFRQKEELSSFVENRERLYFLNKNLHPTIIDVIYEMTALYREDRTTSVEEVIVKLENYREYNPENYVDLTNTEGFRRQDVSERNTWILSRLRNRLFDISRRNKLLYFSSKNKFVNLTINSVPLLLDYKNITENDLIYWSEGIKTKIVDTKKIRLNQYLDFENNRFLAPSLNSIRLEAKKSKDEYGFSQLRTVIAFLHWYNYKENEEERITSPLLLIPTEITKKKGVQDQFDLSFYDGEAEVNPILIHYFKELYDIILPDYINLETTSIENLIASIQSQIDTGNTGIRFKWRKKPKIQLIHSIAKKNYNLKRKKLNNRSKGINLRSFSYSYQSKNYEPLGLQIFKKHIKSKNAVLEAIINDDIKPNVQSIIPEKKTTFYHNDNDGEINPLVWEVDTCNVTLGNFRYRKMSLVSDYNHIIDSKIKDDIFEKIFSERPKHIDLDAYKTVMSHDDLLNNYPIITADPTQWKAVQIAKSGESYIIQGPPGTGKSQTITNLIADYIARRKKVLFVCEKRAALDVVYHRLKNKKLDDLCCLIHDSQTDKKEFIQDLKKTYEDFLTNKVNHNSIQKRRHAIIQLIDQELSSLNYFHQTMKEGTVSPLELYQILLTYTEHATPLTPDDLEQLPTIEEWQQHKSWITQWTKELNKSISEYNLAKVSFEILGSKNPKSKVRELLTDSFYTLDALIERVEVLSFEEAEDQTFFDFDKHFALAQEISKVYEADKLLVFESNSYEYRDFLKLKKELDTLEESKIEQDQKTVNWIQKPDADETSFALQKWKSYKSSVFRFFNPGFYKLKKQITETYDFTKHSIKPDITDVLERLQKAHDIEASITKTHKKAVDTFGVALTQDTLNWIHNTQQEKEVLLQQWINNTNKDYLDFLIQMKDKYNSLQEQCNAMGLSIKHLTLSQLEDQLTDIKQGLVVFHEYKPYIKQLHEVTAALRTILQHKKWSVEEFEFNIAYAALHNIYKNESDFADLDATALQQSILNINTLLQDYYESNVEIIGAEVRQGFLNKIRLTETPVSQLTKEEKEDKKRLNGARRILENEFNKSMRYKPIRELVSGETNELITDIKPVWLMSPLSVSDTMPIKIEMFDVVIYDEASQITVEEAVPALFRTNQTIVVGDEMQMPPTNFFAATNYADEEEEETEEKIGISLDADSILNQGTRKLSSVMLGWHYRSKRESLISFSNTAFYKKRLLTIPDQKINQNVQDVIPPITNTSDEVDINEILERSISFYHLENGVYEKRRNTEEAIYIANIISQLLKSNCNKSIGVVAFSKDQQSEIELALETLSNKDPEFDLLLEEEYQRFDEDQFNGLFVKNLENVQGDERDIIILSICYGFNAHGRMLMNFGPINRSGGEKRLNVIFSRAKEHMVVVTSILDKEIKNEYNPGANYFKKFLSYAKFISDGRLNDANVVLDSIYQNEHQIKVQSVSLIAHQIKEIFVSKGYDVDESIGQSHFKCDLGIKAKEGQKYLLGIMIDRSSFYENENIIEQYCQKSKILEGFGWRIVRIFAKDWFEKQEHCIQQIESILNGEFTILNRSVDVEKLISNHIIKQEIVDQNRNGNTTVKEKVDTTITEEKADEPNTSQKNKKDTQQLHPDIDFTRLEFTSERSNKFWEIGQDNNTLIIRYGRIGNTPQVLSKSYKDTYEATKEMEKLITKKKNKGYQNT